MHLTIRSQRYSVTLDKRCDWSRGIMNAIGRVSSMDQTAQLMLEAVDKRIARLQAMRKMIIEEFG